MKIYVLPIDNSLQPQNQGFLYPKHNSDYGVEQDFYQFLQANPHLLTTNINEADFHYLPVYWTRWHLQHDYGRAGLDELQKLVNEAILDSNKTFTICQYDDGPIINIGKTLQFLASRKTELGIDIPLLCDEHQKKMVIYRYYLASFAGRINTHPIRAEMQRALNSIGNIYISDKDLETEDYVRLLSRSYIALAPRGYGGSSFRFYEAMQLGIIPALIGDIDTRPFKNFIDWDQISFYVSNPADLIAKIKTHSKSELKRMGKKAREVYLNELTYQKWPKWVLADLEKRVG